MLSLGLAAAPMYCNVLQKKTSYIILLLFQGPDPSRGLFEKFCCYLLVRVHIFSNMYLHLSKLQDICQQILIDIIRSWQTSPDLKRSWQISTDQLSVSRKGSGLKVSVMFESQLWLFISFPTACSTGLNAGSIHICDQVIEKYGCFYKTILKSLNLF